MTEPVTQAKIKVDTIGGPEQGPLRTRETPSAEWERHLGLADLVRRIGDHGPVAYVTESDHRSIAGRIIPRGTAAHVARMGGKLFVLLPDLDSVELDATVWATPAVDYHPAPLYAV